MTGTRNFFLVCLLAVAALLLTAAPALADSQCHPRIDITGATPHWASYADYRERLLTVEEDLSNPGTCAPCLLQVTGVDSSNGVSLETPLPVDLGELPAGVTSITVKFRVPPGVVAFLTRTRAICKNPPPVPVTATGLSIDPVLAYANDGCPVGPVPDLPGLPLPADRTYGPRRFAATVTDAGGNPVAGQPVKWSLTAQFDFTLGEHSDVTDANGRAYATVWPPMYFVCITPYFSHGSTKVSVTTGGLATAALFAYTRCAPPGETPPWQTQAGSGL